MSSPIHFGTSGWRAVIADQFTSANVEKAVHGIASYVLSIKEHPALLVGYDTRFLSETFAAQAAKILSSRGIDSYLSQQPVPTPALAYEIRRMKADGGINFTASHNPPEYNGIKFSTPDGAPALPEVTSRIEQAISQPTPLRTPAQEGRIEPADFLPAYLDELARKVNLDVIRSGGLRLVYDPLYGTGINYLGPLLTNAGTSVVMIHGHRDALFGGHPPEPAEEYLEPLRAAMVKHYAHLGVATDGDADRFGIMDGDGTFISPNHILGLLLDYLMETRPWAKEPGWKGGAARSVATTHLVDAVAKSYGLPVHETPVGFKFIGELIERDEIVMGGEESAGMTIRHHLPEKDGILACLLTAEMVASRRAPLGQQLKDLFRKVGSYYPARWNVPLTETVRIHLADRMRQEYSSFDGRRVANVQRTDGLKLILEDGSWVLFRLSGTEPVCRLYCEAATPEELAKLEQAGRKFLLD